MEYVAIKRCSWRQRSAVLMTGSVWFCTHLTKLKKVSRRLLQETGYQGGGCARMRDMK